MSAFWSQFCIEKSRWERESCPLSGIEKRPPLGGYVSIKVMLDTIRNTMVVRCREAVLISEGPLSEARLYTIVYHKSDNHYINFLQAVENDDKGEVRHWLQWLKEGPERLGVVNDRDALGNTAAHLAAKLDRDEILNMLLSSKIGG